jgi:4-diphosphocytidyl-2-C-methyl-D-erythritol kinase
MNQTTLSLKTPSKINIFLKIKNKLPNGYHEIETIFLPLHDICDKITIDFDSSPGIHIRSSSSVIPLNSDNLCYKAAEAYAKKTGIVPAWNIDIEKNIPIAAGMGGGSSDAAAVLLLLQKQHNNILPESQLFSIALKLGADVPYFLNPVPATGKGIGERLTPISMTSGLYIVILAPQFPVSAAWAYKNYKQCSSNKKTDAEELLDCIKTGDWKKLGSLMHNDLAPALYNKFPVLNIFKEKLLEAGAINVEITGSGPTLYGIVDNKQKAEEIVNIIKNEYNEAVACLYSCCMPA